MLLEDISILLKSLSGRGWCAGSIGVQTVLLQTSGLRPYRPLFISLSAGLTAGEVAPKRLWSEEADKW